MRVPGHARAQNLPPELVRYADMILYNGHVLTADQNYTDAQALAVRDGMIVAHRTCATYDEALRFAGVEAAEQPTG